MKPYYLLPLLILCACSPNTNSPTARRVTSIDTIFMQAVAKVHPSYYKGLDCNVISLDLYSKGIEIHGDTLMGTGSNLYFSDIFVPSVDSMLPEHTYRLDSVAAAYNALPAMEFEEHITGSYLVLWQDAGIGKVYLFPSGTFSIKNEGDTTNMEFHLQTADKQTFDATYRGVVRYEF